RSHVRAGGAIPRSPRRLGKTESVRELAPVVLVDPAHGRYRNQAQSDDEDEPGEDQAQEHDADRRCRGQWPPRVWAEEAVLAGEFLDFTVGTVLRAGLDAARDQREVERDHGAEPEGQRQRGRTGGILGHEPVDRRDDREEDRHEHEDRCFDPHFWPPSTSAGPSASVSGPALSGLPWETAATSGYFRSTAGRSLRTRGNDVKLCRGGGLDVAHSSEAPKPQGSSTPTLGASLVCHTFHRNGSVEAANRKELTVETWLSRVKPSSGK